MMILSVSVAAFVVASYNGNLSPVVKFIQTAKDKYGYNSEQALGMLFWHKHDMDRAIRDLANFTPLPDEFSLQDNALFDQAFQVQLYHLDAPLWCENSMTLCFYLQIHGKSFQRIRQMLPEKSLAALIKHYYRWDGDIVKTQLNSTQVGLTTLWVCNSPPPRQTFRPLPDHPGS